MINSVKDLQLMLLNEANKKDTPVSVSRLLMTSPGCSEERINTLRDEIPNLPFSYINIVRSYSINGITINCFSLSPYNFRSADAIEGLIQAYEDPFFPKEFMEKHRMYQIGSYNTDILCVTEGTNVFDEGEILFIEEGYNIYNPEDSQIHPLAKDFEQFLIIAGNLDEIHTEMQGDDSQYDQKKQEFLDRLNILGVDKKYHSVWLSLF